ncbi:hypothetical protein ABI59_19830 [Acidobacteria bacterium Mor1]|nr:hypothetical protein ABI59_19830 [Acidobacteria bacterium Mor1]
MAAGRPVVVHAIVALCDNENQGIVPVPEQLGNGLDPASNLYWGALYGLRTHMKKAGWTRTPVDPPEGGDVLERIVLSRTLTRKGKAVDVHIVADAWRGDRMEQALGAYLAISSGRDSEVVQLPRGEQRLDLHAGGDAHLLVWVGHNGLMDHTIRRVARYPQAKPRAGMVLACLSKEYFTEHFRDVGVHPVLLTTGLMAPEAYTLDAAIRGWVESGDTERVLDQAGAAYHAYQKCGERAARRLFWGVP